MRLIICLPLLSLFILSPGTARPGPAASDQLPADTVITLQRGACEKRCAVYKLVIFADGILIYDGQYFVRRSGLVQGKVDTAAIRKLLDDFRAVNYFELKDQYGYDGTDGCESVESDAPVAITSVASGGRAKSIVHHHRCRGAVPGQLTRLEDEIDKVAGSARWIKRAAPGR